MPSLEFATSQLALPAWAAGAALAVFVVLVVLTLTRAGASVAGALLRVAVVLGAFASVWLLLQQGMLRERAAERRALDQRAADLAMRAAAPGSSLACLDAIAGEAVETACEKQLFASPQSVAAAVSYVSARLALLGDAVDFVHRGGARYEAGVSTMRLALEADRFGFVAHVLSVRDSCTPLLCDSYVLFKDPDRVQANLRERLFDRHVERYAPEWVAPAQPPAPGVAAAAPAAPGGVYTTASSPPTPASPSKFDFPSAASIPPVSIMTPEPGAPPDPKAAAPAPVPTPPPAPTRRGGHPLHPAHTPPRAATAAPQQIVPPPAATANPAPH